MTVWWVTKRTFLKNGGRKYSGPYSTREDAAAARRTLEQLIPVDLCIDSEEQHIDEEGLSA